MIISEIISPNSSQQDLVNAIKTGKTMGKIEQNLKKLGWNLLSFGNFGQVFSKSDSPFVIKITKTEDIGYEAFLSVIRRHPNKHFPKISKDIIVNGFYVYFIEKLHQFNNDVLIREMDNYFSLLDMKYIQGYEKQKQKIVAFERKYKSLANALEILKNVTEEDETSNLMLDITSGNNVMQRKDGTPVIIDPFVDRSVFSAEEDHDGADFGDDEYI